MVVGLGCEKLTYDRVLPPEDINPENCLTLQDWKGHDAMMQAIMDMAEKKLQKLNLRHRRSCPSVSCSSVCSAAAATHFPASPPTPAQAMQRICW